jgi:hypothetical protein
MPKVASHTDLKKAVPTRRTVLRTSALVTTALSTPFIRGAHAADQAFFWRLGPLGTFQRLNTRQWNSQRLNPRNIG